MIVFAPTFRGAGQATAYYPYDSYIDYQALWEMCERTNSYFVFEMHHFIEERPEIPPAFANRLKDLSDESLGDLLYVADVLVTDYSSCFYDCLLLQKPVVFYVPDKVEYSGYAWRAALGGRHGAGGGVRHVRRVRGRARESRLPLDGARTHR